MLYEIRLESNNGLIFTRFFYNLLELDKETEAKEILEELAQKIDNELVKKTIARFGKLIPKTNEKNECYNLTLRNKNGIFVIVEIDITNYPNMIKHNLDVREILPDFIKRFKKI